MPGLLYGPVIGSVVAGTLLANAVTAGVGAADAATDPNEPVAAVMASPRAATAQARLKRWCTVNLPSLETQQGPNRR
jgi:hypothetical protein